MARKQITQFTSASAVASTDNLLLQPGPTGTDYVYAPVSMILQGSLACTYSTITVNGASVPANGMYLPATNTLGWSVNTTAEMQMTGTALSPATSDGLALGTTALMWGDLFLASGGVINFNASNVTITHSANALAIVGAAVSITRNSTAGSGETNLVTIDGAQSVADTGSIAGLKVTNEYTAASGNTLTTLYGVNADPANSSTGTITTLVGMRAFPGNVSTGIVTTSYGLLAIPTNSGAGTITTAAGVFARVDNTNASGTITTGYGVFIATPTNSGTMTNKWGLYQQDTASKNFLAGRTLIGTVTDDGSTAFQVNGNAKATGYFLRSVGNALTATGTTRADALQLAKEVNRLTTVASGTGVILPVGVVGMRIRIYQSGANPVKVYASASETIDGTAGSTGVTLTNALRADYEFVDTNTWISAQLGVVSA